MIRMLAGDVVKSTRYDFPLNENHKKTFLPIKHKSEFQI